MLDSICLKGFLMSSIKFPCPNCGKKFKVAEKHCGRTFQCPQCKNSFTVPSMDSFQRENAPLEMQPLEMSPAPQAPLSSPAPAPSKNRLLKSAKVKLPKNLMSNILRAPSYPLKAIFTFVLLALAQLFTIVVVNTILTFILKILVTGFIWSYYFEILRSTANGEDEMPFIVPDKAEAFVNFFRLLTIHIVCFCLPLLYFFVAKTIGHTPSLIEYGLLAFAGAFILPLCLLSVGLHETIMALLPDPLFKPFKRLFWQYAAFAAVYWALMLAQLYIARVFSMRSLFAFSLSGILFRLSIDSSHVHHRKLLLVSSRGFWLV